MRAGVWIAVLAAAWASWARGTWAVAAVTDEKVEETCADRALLQLEKNTVVGKVVDEEGEAEASDDPGVAAVEAASQKSTAAGKAVTTEELEKVSPPPTRHAAERQQDSAIDRP
eukprot:CAMPEP_0179039780 /NCGR_PEP_ID=MMETSP0796-20121207/15313_1 /TAXON_ID=73915 /ORGANISM="Pyrodinium bahamense, Strain pbaha01" /LENGTH=113 /DNA_ID=CAMNT_0020736115 /DNA_START=61 /DNA_END=400 /DNA_ORIENTATION=-